MGMALLPGGRLSSTWACRPDSETRRQRSRSSLRYEADFADAERGVVEPLMPSPAPCGRPPFRTGREVSNGIFYVLRDRISRR